MKNTGKKLAKRWGLHDFGEAKFSAWGNWYASIKRYPVVLLDSHGYVRFETNDELRSTEGVKVTKQINIPKGINSLSGYVRVVSEIPESGILDGDAFRAHVDKVLVNRYERSRTAREICLKAKGYNCSVCGLVMKEIYGLEASTYIHVHHVIPVSQMSDDYVIDPEHDLVPVCPNCHGFIHLFKPPLSITSAKERFISSRGIGDLNNKGSSRASGRSSDLNDG